MNPKGSVILCIFGCLVQIFSLLGKLKIIKLEAEEVQRVLCNREKAAEQIFFLQTIPHCHKFLNAKVQGNQDSF